MPSAESARAAYHDRLMPVIEYIRTNPTAELSVESLARRAHFSPFHFHRIFRALMGETVGEFVRRTRLERAAHLMRAVPERPLSDVATQAGFGSLSHFSRTFRRHYGVPPSRWDRASVLKWSRDGGEESLAAHFANQAAGDDGPEPEVRLRETPAMTLGFVRVPGMFEPDALQRGYDRLRGWLRSRELGETQLISMSWSHVELAQPEHVSCDLCARVPPGTEGGDGVAIRDFPPLVVAASRVRGTQARNVRVWYRLYDWLVTTSFEPCNLPIFTWHFGWPDRLDDDRHDHDSCIPLRRLDE